MLCSISNCDGTHSLVVEDLLVNATARKIAPMARAISEARIMDKMTLQGVHLQQVVAHVLEEEFFEYDEIIDGTDFLFLLFFFCSSA